jgi:hypothetical protein
MISLCYQLLSISERFWRMESNCCNFFSGNSGNEDLTILTLAVLTKLTGCCQFCHFAGGQILYFLRFKFQYFNSPRQLLHALPYLLHPGSRHPARSATAKVQDVLNAANAGAVCRPTLPYLLQPCTPSNKREGANVPKVEVRWV